MIQPSKLMSFLLVGIAPKIKKYDAYEVSAGNDVLSSTLH